MNTPYNYTAILLWVVACVFFASGYAKGKFVNEKVIKDLKGGITMECTCEIDVEHDGGPECSKEKIVKARKKHVCFECLKDIQPGQEYEYVFGIWDGEPSVYKTCLDCKSIRDTFFSSWTYTQVWDDFRDQFGYDDSKIPESCISELTPGARARVCHFIECVWED